MKRIGFRHWNDSSKFGDTFVVAFLLLLSVSVSVFASDLDTVRVIGDKRFQMCRDSGGFPVTGSGGGYAGCHHPNAPQTFSGSDVGGGGGSGGVGPLVLPNDGATDAGEKDCIGNPIIPSNGNKVSFEEDFRSSGEMGITLSRTYNHYWLGIGLFGKHWLSNFDYRLTFGSIGVDNCFPRPGGGFCGVGSNAIIYAWRPDGRTVKYVRSVADGVFYEDKPNPISRIIPAANGAFNLYNEANGVEHYTSAGYLWSIRNEHGIGWTFSYQDSRPTRITHTSGRYIEFTWDANRLVAVRDPAGTFHGYGYHLNAFGNGLHRLASSVRPGSPSTTAIYHYENSLFPGALTGKSINGMRYAKFDYDSSGRAILSEHNGVDRHSFTYTASANGLLTVRHINPLGNKVHIATRMGGCNQ